MKKLKVDKQGGKAKNQKVVGTEMERILGNEAVIGYETVVKRELKEGQMLAEWQGWRGEEEGQGGAFCLCISHKTENYYGEGQDLFKLWKADIIYLKEIIQELINNPCKPKLFCPQSKWF